MNICIFHLHYNHPLVTIVVLAEMGIPGVLPIMVLWLLFSLQQKLDNYSKQSRFTMGIILGCYYQVTCESLKPQAALLLLINEPGI